MSKKLTRETPARRSFKVTDWKPFVSKLSSVMAKTKCSNDFRQSRQILSDMGIRPDVLPYCEDNGGYCDCEIILNVGPPTKFDFTETKARSSSRKRRSEMRRDTDVRRRSETVGRAAPRKIRVTKSDSRRDAR